MEVEGPYASNAPGTLQITMRDALSVTTEVQWATAMKIKNGIAAGEWVHIQPTDLTGHAILINPIFVQTVHWGPK